MTAPAFHLNRRSKPYRVPDGPEGVVVNSPGACPRESAAKQTFSAPSVNTLLVNEYIYRYGGFDGFFTASNVTLLTGATDKQ